MDISGERHHHDGLTEVPPRQIWPADLAARYRAKGYWRGQNLGDVLRESAATWPDRTAVVGGRNRWSYTELLTRAEAAAGGFLALGLIRGDRVIVQLPNIAAFLPVTFGLFLAGLVPVYADLRGELMGILGIAADQPEQGRTPVMFPVAAGPRNRKRQKTALKQPLSAVCFGETRVGSNKINDLGEQVQITPARPRKHTTAGQAATWDSSRTFHSATS